ncbi:MAG: uracil-DNA glycosylase [Alphaproteobacteria bacterium]|nr:uracil-DNA glycosylase [Alphaproteobacteria bacterium]
MTVADSLDPLSALRWLRDVGADDIVLEAPIDRYQAAPPQAPAAPRPIASESPRVRRSEPAPERPAYEQGTARQIEAGLRPAGGLDRSADLQSAKALAGRANTLPELRAALERFEGCPLKHSAKNLVFADGNPEADLMFVGEAPGRDEDEQGLPFVGVSGQLLDRIAAAIGRDRRSFYIVNVLPWRPPDNREPALAEATVCLPFLMRHIAIVKPKVVMALGATAAKNLFDTTEGITRLRGRWLELNADGHVCPAMATFHPAALLRMPLNKRYVWRDMLSVQAKLEALR